MFSRIVTVGDNDRMVVVDEEVGETESRKLHEEVTARGDDSVTWGSGSGGKEQNI